MTVFIQNDTTENWKKSSLSSKKEVGYQSQLNLNSSQPLDSFPTMIIEENDYGTLYREDPLN